MLLPVGEHATGRDALEAGAAEPAHAVVLPAPILDAVLVLHVALDARRHADLARVFGLEVDRAHVARARCAEEAGQLNVPAGEESQW